MLGSFLSEVFLLHIPCWLLFYLGSVSYTSRAGFVCFCCCCFFRFFLLFFLLFSSLSGESLTHPMLDLLFCGEFLLYIPCWLLFFLFLFLSFFFYLGSFSYTSHIGYTFLWVVCLTQPLQTSFLCGEFLLHIPICLHFYPESFSYRSRVGFVFF